MSGICISRDVIGNVLFNVYKRFLFLSRFFTFLTFFLFFNVYLHLCLVEQEAQLPQR